MSYHFGTVTNGTGVSNACEVPCGYQESNLGSQEKHLMLLRTRPSLQPQTFFFLKNRLLGLYSQVRITVESLVGVL